MSPTNDRYTDEEIRMIVRDEMNEPIKRLELGVSDLHTTIRNAKWWIVAVVAIVTMLGQMAQPMFQVVEKAHANNNGHSSQQLESTK